MHFVGRAKDRVFALNPVYEGHSEGFTSASLIDHTCGSVHTGLSLSVLAPGGSIAPHVHSFERGFYILEGHANVTIGTGDDARAYLMGPGDFGALKVGTAHAWSNEGPAPVRWLAMAAPQPKPLGKERDTFFFKGGWQAMRSAGAGAPVPQPLASSDLTGKLLGHFDASQIPPPDQRTQTFAAAPGVFLKWMIDENFGARHHRMLFIEYQPDVSIALHDHTFEEGYFLLSGEIEGILDGERYVAGPGDVLWTSVGCVHTFKNIGKQPVRWIETFSPQPPAENVFRFMGEWEKKAREMEG